MFMSLYIHIYICICIHIYTYTSLSNTHIYGAFMVAKSRREVLDSMDCICIWSSASMC